MIFNLFYPCSDWWLTVSWITHNFWISLNIIYVEIIKTIFININSWNLYVNICYAAAAAKSLQSCPTLRDPIDGSPPGPAVPGILQARTLAWVAISSFNAWKWKVKMKSLSHVRLLATPWTAAYQAPLSMGFSKQEYLSGVPLPSPIYVIHVYIYMYISYDKEWYLWIENP